MALQDPVAIFTASSNVRAQALCHVLAQSGVEAHVIEDFSGVGLWVGGTIPGIHGPQVWVDRADAERAASIIREHECREEELRADPSSVTEAERVQSVCEECGQITEFPASQLGSVQECSQCGAFVDVVAEEEGDNQVGDDEDLPAETTDG